MSTNRLLPKAIPKSHLSKAAEHFIQSHLTLYTEVDKLYREAKDGYLNLLPQAKLEKILAHLSQLKILFENFYDTWGMQNLLNPKASVNILGHTWYIAQSYYLHAAVNFELLLRSDFTQYSSKEQVDNQFDAMISSYVASAKYYYNLAGIVTDVQGLDLFLWDKKNDLNSYKEYLSLPNKPRTQLAGRTTKVKASDFASINSSNYNPRFLASSMNTDEILEDKRGFDAVIILSQKFKL
ncbi:MAG: hypothetical protein ABI597_07525 [Gammaproteobacteria bacterium]